LSVEGVLRFEVEDVQKDIKVFLRRFRLNAFAHNPDAKLLWKILQNIIYLTRLSHFEEYLSVYKHKEMEKGKGKSFPRKMLEKTSKIDFN